MASVVILWRQRCLSSVLLRFKDGDHLSCLKKETNTLQTYKFNNQKQNDRSADQRWTTPPTGRQRLWFKAENSRNCGIVVLQGELRLALCAGVVRHGQRGPC